MDETLTRVALDASNRPYLVWKVDFSRPKLGEMDTELFKEWFQAFAQSAGVTLHVENLYGENNHHIVESCFKGLARALAPGGRDRSAPRRRGALDQGHARRQPLAHDRRDHRLRLGQSALGGEGVRARGAREPASRAEIVVTSDAGRGCARPTAIVLPGVGAFADCRRGLAAVPGSRSGADARR